jgi:argininosuccinate lyase
MKVLNSSKNPGNEKKLFEFTHGVDVDCFLAQQEIQVQKAWVTSLASAQFLSSQEAHQLTLALEEALGLMKAGKFEWKVEDEDIHINLERFLVEKLGETGKRIHLGRSRNDLIATTLRLYFKDKLVEIEKSVQQLALTLAKRAEDLAQVIVPGMTHLQHGQPIRFGHILAAHGWAFSRDLHKLKFAQESAMASLPLGSAALAGTTIPVNLESLASSLGFRSPSWNSYDSVGDRDFVMEAMDAIAQLGIHLSRISEDFIIWSSTAIGLVQLPPNWSTGSSIMPNKRNPDVPELIRAKSAHLIAATSNTKILLKGLPSSYQSDLHELKSIFIRSSGDLLKCLEVLNYFVSEFSVHTDRAQSLLSKGNILATEVANALALQGVPFREAYRQTAALVEVSDQQGISIQELDLEKLKKIVPQLDSQWLSQLSYESAVEQRNFSGGTALNQVLAGIKKLKEIAGTPS